MAIPSLSAADNYHSIRQNAAWGDLENDGKTAALTRAEDYIRAFYHFNDDVEASNPLIVEANIMLAGEMLSPVSLKAEAQVIERSEKLDVLEESVTYSEEGIRDPYPQVTALLRPLLKSARGSAFTVVKLER